MRPRYRPRNKTGYVDTYYNDVLGNEIEVSVAFRVNPPEPDVGFDGGIDIDGVFLKDGRIDNRIEVPDSEWPGLEQRVIDQVSEMGEEDI